MPKSPPPDIAQHRGRSHPPSLIRLAERLIREEQLIERGDVVLCACSGGPDSNALLSVLAHLRRQFRFELAAHGVDHGLRGEEAGELELAGRLAASLGVPFSTSTVRIEPGGNLQARARSARRAALRAAARAARAVRIATGHTADDRAETFLLRLLRGSGPLGLAVLPPSAPLDAASSDADPEREIDPLQATITDHPEAGNHREARAGEPEKSYKNKAKEAEITLIRPLLLARRADVVAHLRRRDLPAASDPSNTDPRFLRVRVRAELLPLMESMAPRITEHLCALADMLASQEAPTAGLRDLGRAQRLAVARAKKCERPVNLRVSGGKDVTVAFSDGEPVLMEAVRSRGH